MAGPNAGHNQRGFREPFQSRASSSLCTMDVKPFLRGVDAGLGLRLSNRGVFADPYPGPALGGPQTVSWGHILATGLGLP